MSSHIDATPQSMEGRQASDFRGAGRFADSGASVLSKPRLRGWIHFYCAYAALVAGSVLVTVSWAVTSTRAGHATLAYTLAIVAMFGVSATYHRVSWGSTAARSWMRRLDHSMIFVFIAGTYTPFARLDMPASTGHQVLAIVWGGALAGVALTLFWPDAPALARRGAIFAPWLGGGFVCRDDPAQRGRGRGGTARGRRRTLQPWCGVLRTPLARPVACDLRLSRDISRAYRSRGAVPLRGGLHCVF